MKLNTVFAEKTCIITIEGSIDTLTAHELEQTVNDAAPRCEKMVLDMTKVDYISSGGLRVVGAFAPLSPAYPVERLEYIRYRNAWADWDRLSPYTNL